MTYNVEQERRINSHNILYCRNCVALDREYNTILSKEGYICCNTCGLVICDDRLSPNLFFNTQATFSEIKNKNRKIKKIIPKNIQRYNHFNNVLLSYSSNYNFLSENLLSVAYEKAKECEYWTEFKRRPNQKNTTKILGSIIIPESIAINFKSRKTSLPLYKLNRKNISSKWLQFRNYFIQMERMTINNFIKDDYIPLSENLIIILPDIYKWIMNEYSKLRHERICLNSSMKCSCRIAQPNTYTMIFTLLFIINPFLIDKYKYTIKIPKLKTIKKNINTIINLLRYIYNDPYVLNQIIYNHLKDFYKHLFLSSNKVDDEFFLNEEEKNNNIELEKWILKILSHKREDWLKIITINLTPIFYPIIWKKYIIQKSLIKE